MSIQLTYKDQYAEAYGQKYIDKMNYLVKVVTEYQTGRDRFNVFNFEAGLGKSFTVDRILNELVNKRFADWDFISDQRFLIVKRFNDESDKSVKYIEKGFVRDESLAITLR